MLVEPARLIEPGGQAMQLSAPDTFPNVPAEHGEQTGSTVWIPPLVTICEAPNVPLGQFVHAAAPSSEKVPSGQGVQNIEPFALEYVPEVQF